MPRRDSKPGAMFLFEHIDFLWCERQKPRGRFRAKLPSGNLRRTGSPSPYEFENPAKAEFYIFKQPKSFIMKML